MIKIKRAVISVFDKRGIVKFAKELQKLNIEILSTGGTASLLKKNKIKVINVSKYTKHPEILGGRVKTLHPKIHAGILALRDNKGHIKEVSRYDVELIDMVVVNLYPFLKTISKKNVKMKDVIENIDIGGPTMLRSAAKNYQHVVPVVDPQDYDGVIDELKKNKGISEEASRELAIKCFKHTARYDSTISNYLSDRFYPIEFPDILNISFNKIQDLRYGENPHQRGAFYREQLIKEACVSNAKQLHGKELSFNNILDANDALELVKDFDKPTAAVIKHTSPSGVATRKKIEDAYKTAYQADPMSAFGGVVALNRRCNLATAKIMKSLFIEVVVCPRFEKDALKLLKQKKNIRLLETGALKEPYYGKSYEKDFRKVVGGLLIQTKTFPKILEKNFKIVTKRKPTKNEIKDMIFAWKVNKHVKSNSIVFAKNEATVGIGAGQMSRVDSSMIAARKAGKKAKGAVMSSDAFFPFRDGVDEAAKAGVKAIIQPGGSIRDKEIIDAANEHGMAMVFTGIRLFKH